MRRAYTLAALLAITALSLMPASAQAAKKQAWQDCRAHGGSTLTGTYTIAELNEALRTMPAYVEEYSNCYGVIQAQLLKQQLAEKHPKAHTTSVGSSGGGSTVLIVAIAVVAVGGAGLALWASRRRRHGSPPSDGPPPADG